MIVVKVEIHPAGNADEAFEIARLGIANVSPLDGMQNWNEYSDYETTALLDRVGEERVLKTEVKSHERALGWIPLVRRVLTNLHLKDETCQEVSYDDPMAQALRKG